MFAKITNEEAAELMSRTEEIELEKEAKRLEREQRKLEKEAKAKAAFREKLVAPILLILSMAVAFALFLFRS